MIKLKSLFVGLILAAGILSCENLDDGSYVDGETILLNKATKGNGINIVMLGDGYIWSDLETGGLYIGTMRKCMDAFFSIEPVKSFKEYFNVYTVICESRNTFVSENSATYFNLTVGQDGLPVFDLDKCIRSVGKAVGDGFTDTVILLIGNEEYFRPATSYFGDRDSNAVCSICLQSEAIARVVLHESVGHGIGRLADEYVEFDEEIPQSLIDYYNHEYEQFGFRGNIDFSSDPSTVRWAHFMDNPDYPEVGIFEGAARYRSGIWRSEQHSIMTDGDAMYFNARCRELIYKRIKELAGEEYSIEEFLRYDKKNLAGTRLWN